MYSKVLLLISGMLAAVSKGNLLAASSLESNSILNPSQIDEFRNRGILRLREFHSSELCNQLVDAFWNSIGQYGVLRDDQSTWSFTGNPVLEFRPLKNALKRTNTGLLYTASLRGLAQVLVGEDELTEWSAQWLITFPHLPSRYPNKVWEVPRTIWHTDCPRLPESKAPGVVVLNYLSDVEPLGDGTVVIAGSHRLYRDEFQRVSSRQFKKKLKRHEFFQVLYSKSPDRPADLRGAKAIVEGVNVEVTELTGAAGDVVILDGRLLHSIAENVGTSPRLMARTFFGSRSLFESYAHQTD
ncbi:MAG: phytanoyl-CoA dioxygenase family protein [Gammaproteobacteria bacterium]|nr:phytanoyl-CoA dioxygenase family protein [Gammaproteobacteria bacterium]